MTITHPTTIKHPHSSSISRGFTLIENMVVVIIIGVLGALIVPNILGRANEARISAAHSDINTLTNALDLYHLDNNHFPSTDQGLEALISKPNGSPEPRNWNAGGYLKRLPQDPWGNDYIYLSPGAENEFDIFSLGADGEQGGEDQNADIGNW